MQCSLSTLAPCDEATIEDIFSKTKTIAIIGLSPDPTKDSHKVAQYLQEKGFRIFPVYPKEETILGEKVYRNVREIPFPVDMVNMFRKAEIADTLIKEVLERKDIKVFWLQLEIINNEACEVAKKNGIIAIQNKCTKLEYARLMA